MCWNAKGRGNLVNRDFNGVGASKPPDAKTMGRWGFALGPEGSQKDSGTSSGDRLTDQRQFDGRRTLRVWTGAMKRVGEFAGE
jgi:hypothetical protein